ncbi:MULTISPECIES: PAS domain S-box protein [unclassified Rhizobium]|uniref:PAS domain S-box protein n=1 Tax=unclassified Rhizobium TaxID=2613769 RepID=UPI00382A682D
MRKEETSANNRCERSPESQASVINGSFHQSESSAQTLLAAIVENSDDAIISKSINGIITSWNQGAERLFGYTPEEAIGQHIALIIPKDRLHEEETIISNIRQGRKIEHYETVRQHKNGTFLDISLTVSPIRDGNGVIVGASKIARDISERKRDAERQALLLREMNHRIKNIFAVVSALIGLGERNASSIKELAIDLRARMTALAIAHELTLPAIGASSLQCEDTTMFALVRALFAAHRDNGVERVTICGDDFLVQGPSLTSLALLLHEFATNATKYGALSSAHGRVEIDVRCDEALKLCWKEIGGPTVTPNETKGFGAQLERATISSLGGSVEREWNPAGLIIRLTIPLNAFGVPTSTSTSTS